MALEPGRHIDEQRKTRRVGFGKTIFAETLDLLEYTFSESSVMTPLHHAVDEFFLEEFKTTAFFPCRHSTA